MFPVALNQTRGKRDKSGESRNAVSVSAVLCKRVPTLTSFACKMHTNLDYPLLHFPTRRRIDACDAGSHTAAVEMCRCCL